MTEPVPGGGPPVLGMRWVKLTISADMLPVLIAPLARCGAILPIGPFADASPIIDVFAASRPAGVK